MNYAILIERSDTGYGAYAPDVPGVGVTGKSPEEVRRLLHEAITLHLEGLAADGEPAPTASTEIGYVETAAA